MFRRFIFPLWFLTGLFCAQAAAAQEKWETTFLGPFSEPLWTWLAQAPILPWVAATLAILAASVLIIHRLRLRRRDMRLAISGLPNGRRFRVVDAMCHAVGKGRKVDDKRLARALEIARDATDMNFTTEHLREISQRTDGFILPVNFFWMREGLNNAEKLVVFNSTLSVLLANGPLSRSDRRFLRALAQGLGLGKTDLRHLARLVTL